MQPTEAAYVAGLLDGEGCISISFRGARAVSREVNTQVNIQVTCSMTDRQTVEWLAKVTGTEDKVYFVKSRNEAHRDQWCWRPGIRKASEVLEECLPYMITKRRQAEILVELVKIRSASTRSERRWKGQFRLVTENLELNRRGV